jgi:hypothetical protein
MFCTAPVTLTCAPGQYRALKTDISPGETFSADNSECVACRIGTFSDSPNAAQCQVCPLGKLGNSTGLTSCVDCGAGSFAPFTGLSTCYSCPAATSQPLTGQAACNDCAAGKLGAQAELTTCALCAVGKFSGVKARFCNACGVGKFAASSGRAACAACQNGRVSNVIGASTCTACAANTFQPGGTNQCIDCPRGLNAARGARKCQQNTILGNLTSTRKSTVNAPLRFFSIPVTVTTVESGVSNTTAARHQYNRNITMGVAADKYALLAGQQIAVANIEFEEGEVTTSTRRRRRTFAETSTVVKIEVNRINSDGTKQSGALPVGEFISVQMCNSTWTAKTPVTLFVKLVEANGDATFENVVVNCNKRAGQTLRARREFTAATSCFSFPICHTSDFYLGEAFDTGGGGSSSDSTGAILGGVIAAITIIGFAVLIVKRRAATSATAKMHADDAGDAMKAPDALKAAPTLEDGLKPQIVTLPPIVRDGVEV